MLMGSFQSFKYLGECYMFIVQYLGVREWFVRSEDNVIDILRFCFRNKNKINIDKVYREELFDFMVLFLKSKVDISWDLEYVRQIEQIDQAFFDFQLQNFIFLFVSRILWNQGFMIYSQIRQERNFL